MRKIYIALLLLIAFAACRQKDLQVTPVGQPLPYKGSQKTVSQLLDSSNLTIFKAAWKRVNMDSTLASQALQAYTVLAPTDDAFKAAGLTMDAINSMDLNDLDTLVRYHMIDTWVTMDQLKSAIGNAQFRSVLKRWDIPYYSENDPYYYIHCLGLHGGKLMINGTAHPLNALDAKNGSVYMIDQVQRKPENDMIDYLQNNPDFSLFMMACQINDSIYINNYVYVTFLDMLTESSDTRQFTLFVPDNNAFHAAGYYTYDDLLARATRNPVEYAYVDPDNYYVNPVSSLDSQLIALHLDFNDANRPQRPVLYYSNDLTDNPSLSGALLYAGQQYSNPPQHVRLKFSTSGDKILISQLGSSLPAVPLVKTDLRFRNGVIHVIDAGLLTP